MITTSTHNVTRVVSEYVLVLADFDLKQPVVLAADKVAVNSHGRLPPALFDPTSTTFSLGEDSLTKFQGTRTWPSPKPDSTYDVIPCVCASVRSLVGPLVRLCVCAPARMASCARVTPAVRTTRPPASHALACSSSPELKLLVSFCLDYTRCLEAHIADSINHEYLVYCQHITWIQKIERLLKVLSCMFRVCMVEWSYAFQHISSYFMRQHPMTFKMNSARSSRFSPGWPSNSADMIIGTAFVSMQSIVAVLHVFCVRSHVQHPSSH